MQLEKAELNSKKSLKDLATNLDQQWGKKLRFAPFSNFNLDDLIFP